MELNEVKEGRNRCGWDTYIESICRDLITSIEKNDISNYNGVDRYLIFFSMTDDFDLTIIFNLSD